MKHLVQSIGERRRDVSALRQRRVPSLTSPSLSFTHTVHRRARTFYGVLISANRMNKGDRARYLFGGHESRSYVVLCSLCGLRGRDFSVPYSLFDGPGGISRERCISDRTSVTVGSLSLSLCPTSVNRFEERCPQLIRSLCIARSNALQISAFFPRLSLNSFIARIVR